MATGEFEGKDAHHPDIRRMFTKDYLLSSDWYRERLEVKQQRDIALWGRHVDSLSRFMSCDSHEQPAGDMRIEERLSYAREQLAWVSRPEYVDSLVGTIGADPLKPARCLSAQSTAETRRVVA